MKNLRLMALILGATLMPFAVNSALAKSEGNPAKEAPTAASSTGKAGSAQRPKATVEDVVKLITNATFARLDTDKDGKVSHDEFMAPHEKQFKETDADNNGFWTKEEYADFRIEQMKGRLERHKKQ